jgi:hypothetical protein
MVLIAVVFLKGMIAYPTFTLSVTISEVAVFDSYYTTMQKVHEYKKTVLFT